MPTLALDQMVTLYYEDDDFTDPWESAPTILLQHGFSRSARFWYNWVPLLGAEFHILRPDMRGMGQSTMLDEKYDPLLATFAAGGDWDAALQQGVGNWSSATIDMRLDTRVAPAGLRDWYIAEMDRTSPTVARKLQAYVDTLDCRDVLSEITVPTLLLVGEEPLPRPWRSSSLWPSTFPTVTWRSIPSWDTALTCCNRSGVCNRCGNFYSSSRLSPVSC
ncbi:MAG: hypothetical protein O7G88_04170 [bacterium]|nr:hypothetical protein [bacterium]